MTARNRYTRRHLLAGMSAMGAAAALAACGDTVAPTPTTGAAAGAATTAGGSAATPTVRVLGTQQPTAVPAFGGASAVAPTTGAAATSAPATMATAASGAAASPAAMGTNPPVAAAAMGMRGGTVRFPLGSDGVPNPITVPGGLASIFTNKAMFNGLVRYNSRTLNPEGDLAEKWEFGAGGKELTFTLRPNVKWHDGRPFTADDVKFTFDTMMRPNITARFRSNIKGVNAVVVNSPTSVTLKLDSTLPSLPIQLGYNIHMVPKHLLENQDINAPADFLKKPIGTGAFKFVEYTPGSTLTVERNDAFHFGAPLLDRIQFKVVPDINAQLAQLKAGDLDFMLMEPDQVAGVRNDANITVQNAAQVNYYYIAYNNENAVLKDKAVRIALTMGLDRGAIVRDVLGGAGTVANGPINPLLAWAYTDDVKKVPFDARGAGMMLDMAGWTMGSGGVREKAGQKLAFELIVDKGNTTRESVAQIAQQAWKAIGVDAKITVMEFNASLDRFNKGMYDAIVEWYITPPDPDVFAWYSTGGTSNLWKYSNPQVDMLLGQARTELDQAKAGAAYKQVLGLLAEDQPITFLYYPQEIRGLRSRLLNVPAVGIRDAMVYAYQWSIRQ